MTKYLKKIENCAVEDIYFNKEQVEMNNYPANTERGIVNVFDEVVYQWVLGFAKP